MRDLLENCKVFQKNDEFEIRTLARGMTREEVATCFGYDFSELEDADRRYLNAHWTRGRKAGIAQAVEDLFVQMKHPKTGADVCLNYLTRFADDWPEEGVSAGAGFNFKVLMEKD